jgi:ABC-type phosphate transport system substrate-binding protein
MELVMKKHIILTFCTLLFTGLAANAEDLIVIANNNVTVSSVTRAELQNIFLGKTVKWPDGKKIKPVVLKEGGTHEKFLNDLLGKSTAQFDSYWKQVIFTGKGRPPKTADSEEEMVQFVSDTGNAVGYIDSGTAHADVKKIEVK